MSALPVDRPIELAMSHWPTGERCARSPEVRAIAERMAKWRDTPETCANCRQPAASVRGGVAICGVCREQRTAPDTLSPVRGRLAAEIRAIEHDSGSALRGHAIVFNALSVDLGGFRERIRPEAVDRLLAEGTDLRALWNHNSELTIGRVQAGTLIVRKDRQGLAVEIHPPHWASSHVETVTRGDVTGMSFAFSAIEDEWHLESGVPIREVIDMHVMEVSGVSFPAYPATNLSVGSTGRDVQWMQKVLRARMAR